MNGLLFQKNIGWGLTIRQAHFSTCLFDLFGKKGAYIHNKQTVELTDLFFRNLSLKNKTFTKSFLSLSLYMQRIELLFAFFHFWQKVESFFLLIRQRLMISNHFAFSDQYTRVNFMKIVCTKLESKFLLRQTAVYEF